MVPERMSAVVYRRYGGPEVLEWVTDAALPEVKPGQVLVRVEAAGVNPGDAGVRGGRLKFMTGNRFPQVPGMDVSGVVVRGAGPFQPGEEVFGMSLFLARTYAEYAALPATALAKKPAGLSHVQAAAMPVAALTAWQALQEHGRVRQGSRVLVRGASGGVGSFAVQLARHLGARVTAVCSADNVEYVRSLGAEHVVDYTAQPLESLQERFDLVLDVKGGLPLKQVRGRVARGGRYVTIVPSWGLMALAPLSRLLPLPRMVSMFVRPDGKQLSELGELMARGVLRHPSLEVLPMSRAAEAHRRIETGHTRGKRVLVPDPRLAAEAGTGGEAWVAAAAGPSPAHTAEMSR